MGSVSQYHCDCSYGLHIPQVDGPAHFTANTLELLGPTLLKQRQLAAAGWRLISVPFHEWIRLRGRDAKQVWR